MAYGLRQFLAGAAMSPADLASVAPESASHIAGGPDRGPGASPKAVPGPAIVVIDTSVDDYETLLAGVDNEAEVILLGADQGLADIAAALDGRSDIASLAILSHGTAGQVVLGADSLNQETLADHNGALTAIGARMAAGGDILLYGCHVGAGASGLAFLDALAAVTGADVAASASPTGAAALGGDWRLEVTVGHIESAAAISATAQAAFPGILTAPLFTGLDGTPTFTENGSPVTLDSNVTVSDADLDALGGGNGDYAGAVLTIARVGGANTDDSFGFDTVGGSFSVSGSNLQSGGQTFATFSVTAGTLTIDFTSSGTTASTALANDVLQHIQYQNTSDAPDASAPLDWNFTDAATAGTAVTTITGSTTVTINAVNDDPTNTGSLPTGLSLLEEGTATIDLSSVVVSDVDAGTGSVGLLLSVANGGTITAATSGGVTVANPSSGWYTFTGTVSDLNSYLHNPVNAITYTGAYNVSGTASDTIYLALFDNGNTGTGGGTNVNIGSLAVDITDVNDMPTLNAARTPRSYAMVEGTSAHTIWGTRTGPTSASTVEAGQTISGFSFKVVGVQDGVDEQLTVDGTSIGLADGVSGTTSTNNLTYAVTVSGTTTTVTFTNGALSTSAFINDIKATASYSHAGDNWTSGSRTITIGTFTDSGGTTNGGVDTLVYDSGNAVINVTGVNDAPTLTATGANPTEIVGSAATLFTGAAASTIETGQTLTGFTLTVSNLTDGANEILGLDGSSVTLTDGTTGTSATNGLSYSVSVITGTATVTVTGGAVSEADFQTLINSLSYNNTATSPTTGSNRVVTLTSVTDSGGITNGGIDTSSLSLTSTITVALHNTAATFGGALTGSLSEDTSTLGGAATVTDPDAGQSSFTADTIAGSYGSLTIASNGDWVYDLNETLSGVQSLAAGDTLGDTFTVSSADGTTQDIVFTINGVNDAAV
ncbi:DUF4347 domain-containing protein, partial [Kordiimonas marina]|uniref:DUF4347 domain-containing protein n=1 Tax=Kordiimonas marina TaxID=2872312 RepID=UPI001FF16DFF